MCLSHISTRSDFRSIPSGINICRNPIVPYLARVLAKPDRVPAEFLSYLSKCVMIIPGWALLYILLLVSECIFILCIFLFPLIYFHPHIFWLKWDTIGCAQKSTQSNTVHYSLMFQVCHLGICAFLLSRYIGLSGLVCTACLSSPNAFIG